MCAWLRIFSGSLNEWIRSHGNIGVCEYLELSNQDIMSDPIPHESQSEKVPRPLLDRKRLLDLRETLIAALIVGPIVGSAKWILSQFSDQIEPQPWHGLWMVIPLFVAAGIAARAALRRQSFVISGPFRIFLICYLCAFGLAATTDMMVGSRSSEYIKDEQVSSSWLIHTWIGDWRYAIAKKPSELDTRFRLILLPPVPPGGDLSTRRFQCMTLVQLASLHKATGIGLDLYFEKESETAVDSMFGTVITLAERAAVPVFGGFQPDKNIGGSPPYPPGFNKQFDYDRRGHLQVFIDGDGRTRVIANRLQNMDAKPLSVKIATYLTNRESDSPKPAAYPPSGALLRFVAPPDDCFKEMALDDLLACDNDTAEAMLRGRFLLVGEASEKDTFRTPYGEWSGVRIHLATITSMLGDCLLKKIPWWAGVLTIVVGCYLITFQAANGGSTKRILVVAGVFSGFLIFAAALSIRLWNLWIDIAYAQVAVWLLVALVMAARWRLFSQRTKIQITDRIERETT